MKIRTMDSGPGGFPAPRVAPHASHAFGGIWRLTARRFFTPGYWLTLAGSEWNLYVATCEMYQSSPGEREAAYRELLVLPTTTTRGQAHAQL